MQSGEYEVDLAFLDGSNDEINQIAGYGKNLTIKQRFDRAVNFYEHCYIQSRATSINPPWDHAPDVATLISFRNKMEAKPQAANAEIEATTNAMLDEKMAALWEAAGEIQRNDRATIYADKVKEALRYVESEVQPRMSVTIEQLNKDSGFLTSGTVPTTFVGTVADMDEAMPEEKQWDKLGDAYIQTTPNTGKTVIATGIIGRYFKAGHSLEAAMWSPEKRRELSAIHLATMKTWQQLVTIQQSLSKEIFK
jgi:hypothetical protein